MGSIAAANPGLASLTQMLSGASSPLVSSGMSSSQVQSALQNAPTTDIVQISDEALQLQNMGTLFGTTGESSQSSSNELINNLLATLSGSSGTSAQMANYTNQAQSAELQTLTGTGSTTAL